MPSNRSFLISIVAVLLAVSDVATAQNWTLTSAPTNNWSAICGSGDLNLLAAAEAVGSIYYSSNAGLNWFNSNAGTNSWSSMDSSTNGRFMVAAASRGTIWKSSDLGVTWTTTAAPSNDWVAVALSGAGDRLIAAGSGTVWLSTNFGSDWKLSGAPIVGYPTPWKTVASSSDGKTLVAAQTTFLGAVFASTNFGMDWVNINSGEPWQFASISADGTTVALSSCCEARVFVSTNVGFTWSPSSYGFWGSQSMSADGKKILATEFALPILVTANAGANWTLLNNSPTQTWTAVKLSEDGNHAILTSSNGGIYRWQSLSPFIAGQPQDATVLSAESASLTVATFSATLPFYQWQLNGTNVSGATNSTLVIANATTLNTGNYSVIVSNSCGEAISSNAIITVVPAFLSTGAANSGIADAILSGSVTTGSNATVVWFNWGLDTNYGNATAPVPVTNGAVSLAFTNRITGLAPYTTFHYQAVASNSSGVVLGSDASFITSPRFLPITGSNGIWSGIAWSADGSKLFASDSGALSLSTNFGASWTPLNNPLVSVFIPSSNGTALAAMQGNQFYRSTNLSSWSTNTTPVTFSSFAASADLAKLTAISGSQIYTSTNGGVSWQLTGAPGISWYGPTPPDWCPSLPPRTEPSLRPWPSWALGKVTAAQYTCPPIPGHPGDLFSQIPA
jgi:hypothetical protein